MTEGFSTLEGWYTLHDFRTMDWPAWKALDPREKALVQEELFSLLHRFCAIDEKREGSFGLFDVAGHKADFLFLNLRPTLEEITSLERDLNKTQFARYAKPAYSYVSVVEISNYLHGQEKKPEDMLQDPYVQSRLYPVLPKVKAICFYPMNKKRDGQDNWYTLPVEERRALMRDHGMTGRKFAGQLTQMIGGSIGLDDWEWGVTLFANDPVVFKKVVTDMRFDVVSARYAEFGAFFVGNALDNDQLIKALDGTCHSTSK